MIHSREEIKNDVRLSTEVVVVGSGAGGAPVAKELSSEGRKVVLLEVGNHFTRDDFNLQLRDAFETLYWYGGQNFTLGMPVVQISQGKTLGGTTTVNSGTCFRIPHRVLKKWHVDFGLWEITEEELDLLYSAIEEYLFVQKADTEVIGRNALLFLEGAEKLGLSGGVLRRNAKDCEGYGSCCYGCPSDAKQSANMSYIPDAVKAGCEIYTRCRAEEIVIRNGRAVGVRGHFLDPDKDVPGPSIEVEAEVVVLAAGAFHTPRMLLTQGICDSSGQVGHNLTIHPSNGVWALFEERLDNPKGIPQATYVDEFAADGIMLEGGTTPPVAYALALLRKGKKNSELMCKYPYMGNFGGMLAEHSSHGKVIPHPGDPQRHITFYNIRGDDKRKFNFMTEIQAEIWFSLGAKRVFTQNMRFPELRTPKDLQRLRESKPRMSNYAGAIAFHAKGTCRMGSDPENSVVKHTCETWDIENLFITDASMIPSSLGVNPQMTIFALATRASGYIDDKLEAAAGRKPKAKAEAARG